MSELFRKLYHVGNRKGSLSREAFGIRRDIQLYALQQVVQVQTLFERSLSEGSQTDAKDAQEHLLLDLSLILKWSKRLLWMFQCCKHYILRCRKKSKRNRWRRQSHQRLLNWTRVVFNASFASKCSQHWVQQESITTRPTPSQQKCSAANTAPSLSRSSGTWPTTWIKRTRLPKKCWGTSSVESRWDFQKRKTLTNTRLASDRKEKSVPIIICRLQKIIFSPPWYKVSHA